MLPVIASFVLFANVASPAPARNLLATDSAQRYRDAQQVRTTDRRETVDEFRMKRQEAVDRIKDGRAAFRERLAQIEDDRKRNIVENLAERINTINEKWVNQWNNVLVRLGAIVLKIDERSEGSINTSAAKAAIASAQEAVNAQAGKTYEITIEDEETVGENIRAALGELHQDLRVVQASVKEAREEVVSIMRNLKAENEEE